MAWQRISESWPALGTLARVVYYTKNSAPSSALISRLRTRVQELDRILSDYRADSELNWVCRNAHLRTVRVSREFFTVLEFAQRVSLLSGGVFDVTIGARTRGRRGSVGYQYVALGARTVRLLKADMQLDFGGLAKGFIADEVSAELDRLGLPCHLVSFSGDIVVGDAPPESAGWKIGIGREEQPRLLVRRGVATAGNTFQPGHILDAITEKPFVGEQTLSVIAPNGLTADALDTALLLLPPEKRPALLKSFPGAESLQ